MDILESIKANIEARLMESNWYLRKANQIESGSNKAFYEQGKVVMCQLILNDINNEIKKQANDTKRKAKTPDKKSIQKSIKGNEEHNRQ